MRLVWVKQNKFYQCSSLISSHHVTLFPRLFYHIRLLSTLIFMKSNLIFMIYSLQPPINILRYVNIVESINILILGIGIEMHQIEFYEQEILISYPYCIVSLISLIFFQKTFTRLITRSLYLFS